MLRRLRKLGIDPDLSPDQLTADDVRRFARLDLDPARITWRRVLVSTNPNPNSLTLTL